MNNNNTSLLVVEIIDLVDIIRINMYNYCVINIYIPYSIFEGISITIKV